MIIAVSSKLAEQYGARIRTFAPGVELVSPTPACGGSGAPDAPVRASLSDSSRRVAR